jgi:hypothetical protein
MNDLETRLRDLGPTLDEAMGEAPAAWPQYPEPLAPIRSRRPRAMLAAAAVGLLGVVAAGALLADRSDDGTIAVTSEPPTSAAPAVALPVLDGFALVLPDAPGWTIEMLGRYEDGHTEVLLRGPDGFLAVSRFPGDRIDEKRAWLESEATTAEDGEVLGQAARIYTVPWGPEDDYAVFEVEGHLIEVHGRMDATRFGPVLSSLHVVDEETWLAALEPDVLMHPEGSEVPSA